MKAFFYIIPFLISGAATAQGFGQFENMQKAQELGSILAAEEYCGLSYDQNAIASWIDQNVDPGDMGFAGTLEMMTQGAQFDLSSKSASSKTAHCHSVERTARHYGFID